MELAEGFKVNSRTNTPHLNAACLVDHSFVNFLIHFRIKSALLQGHIAFFEDLIDAGNIPLNKHESTGLILAVLGYSFSHILNAGNQYGLFLVVWPGNPLKQAFETLVNVDFQALVPLLKPTKNGAKYQEIESDVTQVVTIRQIWNKLEHQNDYENRGRKKG